MHSATEIRAKLDQARLLSAQGKQQREIARTLGISVMTLHRWRKSFATGEANEPVADPAPAAANQSTPPSGAGNRIAELELENAQLRRLITDMLLEKVKLDETSRPRRQPTKA